jgi:Zn-dependent protease
MGVWSIRLFRIRGIKLELHLTFLILWAFFAFAGWKEAGWAGVFWFSLLLFVIFTCVVLHELGHSLAAQRYGISVSRILLLPIGGMAQFERIPRDPWKEIVISLAGPAVNVAIVILLLPLAQFTTPGYHRYLPLDFGGLLQAVIWINVVMAVFNLLPIFPMDGGRVFRAVLALRLSYLRATAIAANSAKALAVIGILLAFFKFHTPLTAFLFAFIYFGGDMEYRMVKRREKMSGLFVKDLTRKHYLSIAADAPISQAAALFESFRPGEILVMDGEVPRGYLTARGIRQAIKNGHTAEAVADHCIRKFSVLQAGWPLDPFVEMISQSSQRLYPVYSFGELVGILDTKNLENLISWHRLQERERRTRPQARTG